MTDLSPLRIQLSSIIEGPRARSNSNYGDLTSLAASLLRLGTIHPLVLSRSANGTFLLVAGGRRRRALLSLGVTELVHGAVLRKGAYGFLFEDEVPEDVRLEAELDENLQRHGMDWTESVLLIDRVHSAKVRLHGSSDWGQAQTATLLGYDTATPVSHAIAAAKLLRSGDAAVLQCKSLKELTSLRLKRNEDAALAELQRRNASRLGTTLQVPLGIPVSTASFLDTINLSLSEKPLAPLSPQGPITSAPEVIIPLSAMFICGDALGNQHVNSAVMSNMPESSVDHIITDIPYGIDMDNLDIKNQDSIEAQHEVKQNIEMMEPFLRQSFRLVRPGGFCVFFFDLDHWNYIQETAKSVGWKVQDWPFIACKTSSCRNQAAQYNTTKNYEVCCFLRRDSHTILRKAVTTSWKTYDFHAERALYNNPFAKPFELWKDIFDAVTLPGQTILDPFAGENSSLRAAANCGLDPRGIEISPVHYNRGLENMKKVYAVIHHSNVSFR